jgi:hypothetical protein
VTPLKFSTRPFPIPQVSFFSTKSVLGILDVSSSTLERYRNRLLELACPGFEYRFYAKGYTLSSVICLWEYSQIIKQAGVPIADENIVIHMRDYWNV